VQPAYGEEWIHEFHPLPGETLTVTVARPEAMPGKTLAIDAVTVQSSVGTKATDHTLSFTVRSTQGGTHRITLPADAEILGITIGGQPQNLRPENGELSLPVRPGTQEFTVRWRENAALGLLTRTPAAQLGAEASNLRLNMNLPEQRWLLWTWGPSLGPAVLYWSALLLSLLIAFALGRSGRTPLRTHHWVLLALGFSTFAAPALLIVVAWLFALDWRMRHGAALGRWSFALLQLALTGLTVAALVVLVAAVPVTLLNDPQMQVQGNGSYAHYLAWFADRSDDGTLPAAGALTVPIWIYKTLMLAWALWLANALIGWLRWSWTAFSSGGYWKTLFPRTVVAPSPSPAMAEQGAATGDPQVTDPPRSQ
jgi:hypothetical protein